MMARSRRSNQRPDTVMQDRINQVDKISCTARPDHTVGSQPVKLRSASRRSARCSTTRPLRFTACNDRYLILSRTRPSLIARRSLLRVIRVDLASAASPLMPRFRTSWAHNSFDAKVESRMGAVAWAIRQRSVSHPRSSNRTCPIKASGSPTGFIVRHTGSKPTARGVSTVSNPPSPLDTAVSDGACL